MRATHIHPIAFARSFNRLLTSAKSLLALSSSPDVDATHSAPFAPHSLRYEFEYKTYSLVIWYYYSVLIQNNIWYFGFVVVWFPIFNISVLIYHICILGIRSCCDLYSIISVCVFVLVDLVCYITYVRYTLCEI